MAYFIASRQHSYYWPRDDTSLLHTNCSKQSQLRRSQPSGWFQYPLASSNVTTNWPHVRPNTDTMQHLHWIFHHSLGKHFYFRFILNGFAKICIVHTSNFSIPKIYYESWTDTKLMGLPFLANFKSVYHSQGILWTPKCAKLDVLITHIFANPVTFLQTHTSSLLLTTSVSSTCITASAPRGRGAPVVIRQHALLVTVTPPGYG